MLVSPRRILAVAASFLAARVLAQEATCYAPNGDIANNETYVPCNKLGITQAGIFSSCCRLDGETEQRDICSSSGLCINRQGQPQRGFCTDRTWNSKACVHVCVDEQSGGTPSNSSFMTACNDGTPTYCCGKSNTTCCGTSDAITILTQDAVCTANDTSPAAASDDSGFKGATIGLAVVTGISLVAGLVSTLWLWKQNKSLKRQLSEKAAEPGPAAEPNTPAQTLVEPQYTGQHSSYAGGASPHMYKSTYSTSPRESEFGHGNVQRYSELDASAAVARSEMGSPTPYEQQYQQGRDSPLPDRNASPMTSPRMPHS